MGDEPFGYTTDNDPTLEYRRKLGSGGYGTVHEVLRLPCHFCSES